jgi:hypothetical protein
MNPFAPSKIPESPEPIPRDIELNAAIRSYLPTRRRTDASNLYQGEVCECPMAPQVVP